ncbi:MAG: hypothetical protein Q9208_002660 [Pyrenodesmia sp. 3 TL-2023]
MAPGGDFLARMILGSDIVDEVDFREKAARKARVQAGKDWRAMKGQEAASSSSHYSSDYTSSGGSLQRRETTGGRGRETQGREPSYREISRRDEPSRREAKEATRLTAGQGERLISEQGRGRESAYREMTRGDALSRRDAREATRLTAGQGERLISEQGRGPTQQEGRSRHDSQQAGRSHGVSAKDYAPVTRGQAAYQGGNTHRSELRQSHAASVRGHGGEQSYHASKVSEASPRSHAATMRGQGAEQSYYGGRVVQLSPRYTASQSRR